MECGLLQCEVWCAEVSSCKHNGKHVVTRHHGIGVRGLIRLAAGRRLRWRWSWQVALAAPPATTLKVPVEYYKLPNDCGGAIAEGPYGADGLAWRCITGRFPG